MKRRSFFKKLGISGLVASVAPQIIQEVKAEEHEPFEIDEGVKVDYEIIPFNNDYIEVSESWQHDYLTITHRQLDRVVFHKVLLDACIERHDGRYFINLSDLEKVYNSPVTKIHTRSIWNDVEIDRYYDPDLVLKYAPVEGVFYVENTGTGHHFWEMNGHRWTISPGHNLYGPCIRRNQVMGRIDGRDLRYV